MLKIEDMTNTFKDGLTFNFSNKIILFVEECR